MNNPSATFYAQFADRFTQWAASIDDIRAAFVIGSQARADHPADRWSDLDILLFTTQPGHYLDQSAWLHQLGKVVCSFSTYTADGDPERLTLFDGGYQVDFVVEHTDRLDKLVKAGAVHGNFHRGVRVLLDKDAVSAHILQRDAGAPYAPPISAEAFGQVCHMFWFVVQYIAKQILRDEVWAAKARDGDMKGLLLQMVQWYMKAEKGEGYDTWHAGRFLREWADADIYADISACFSGFGRPESWQALMQTTDLFKRLSHSVAQQYGYDIPPAEGFVILWLDAQSAEIANIR